MKSFFIYSVTVILLVTAAAKFVSASGTAPILMVPDPLLGLPNRQVLLLGAAIESIIIGVLLISRRPWVQLGLIAWLSLLFAIYRIGIWITNAPSTCPCLGTITQKLPISPLIVDRLIFFLFIYMLCGSLLLLFTAGVQNFLKKRHHSSGLTACPP